MTDAVAAIFEQAKALTYEQRKELVKLLVDTFGSTNGVAKQIGEDEHWGKSLNNLMDEIGPIELIYPEIEDPVEWVKRIREDEARQRGLHNWGDEK